MTKLRQKRRKHRTAVLSIALLALPRYDVGHCFTGIPSTELFDKRTSLRHRECAGRNCRMVASCQHRCSVKTTKDLTIYMMKGSISQSESRDSNAPLLDVVDLDDSDIEIILEDDADVELPPIHEMLDLNTSETVSEASTPLLSLDDIDLLTESASIAYFYLKNEIGLSEEALWKITFEAGPVLGMTAGTLRRKVDLLRRTMDLSDEDIRTIVKRQPTILQLSADQNLAPSILLLVRALDLSKADLRSLVIRFPCILCYSTRNLKSKLNFFMRLMGFSKDECRKLLLSEPKLLTAGVKTGLLPHLRFLTSDMEIPVDKLRTIVKKSPRLLLYSLEDNLVPKLIFFLTMNLHMDTRQVLRVLTKYPHFFDYSLNDHILPITAYLMQDLDFQPTEVRQIILSCPRLVTNSLKRIKRFVGYLRFELGLEAAQVKRVLYQAPQSIGLNIETNIERKVAFLRDTFELNDSELRRLIAGMPTLLACSIESNLQPKTEYLRKVFGNTQDLREAILTMPALLGYSLEKRIKPRMEQLVKIGDEPRGITVGIPMKQDAFDRWLNGRQKTLEENAEFDSKAAKQQESVETGAIVHVAKNREEKDGRIVHWTRERRPPSQRVP